MTSDTVAGESPRRSASSFKLTGLGPRRTTLPAPLRFFFLVVTLRSLAQPNRRSKQDCCASRGIRIDIGKKRGFDTLRKCPTNPI